MARVEPSRPRHSTGNPGRPAPWLGAGRPPSRIRAGSSPTPRRFDMPRQTSSGPGSGARGLAPRSRRAGAGGGRGRPEPGAPVGGGRDAGRLSAGAHRSGAGSRDTGRAGRPRAPRSSRSHVAALAAEDALVEALLVALEVGAALERAVGVAELAAGRVAAAGGVGRLGSASETRRERIGLGAAADARSRRAGAGPDVRGRRGTAIPPSAAPDTSAPAPRRSGGGACSR